MTKTQTFEKLDKLANGLRDISGLPDPEREKTPEYKKWRTAIDTLPKEEKKEYYTRAYEASRQERMNEDGYNIIKPDTKIIFFWLGKKVIKEEKLLSAKKDIEKTMLGDGESIDKRTIKNPKVQDIGVPEIVDIDYSDIKDISITKNGSSLIPYRDGFLIVRDDNPKRYHTFQLSTYSESSSKEPTMFSHILTVNHITSYFARGGFKNNPAININDVNIYFVFKKAFKNKAFKINLKNNKSLISSFNKTAVLDKQHQGIINTVNILPKKYVENYVEGLGVLDNYETILDMEGVQGRDEEFQFIKKNKLTFSKEKLLETGYYFSIFSKVITIMPKLISILSDYKPEKSKDTFLDQFAHIDPEDFEAIGKKLINMLLDKSMDYKGAKQFYKKLLLDNRKDEGYIYTEDLLGDILNLIISYQDTDQGTSLPMTGKINVEGKTDLDCLCYWTFINNFNLFNGCLDSEDFPLILNNGKVLNENELYKEKDIQMRLAENCLPDLNKNFNLNPTIKEEVSNILTEAMEQTTGLLVPYNSCVELADDPIFRYVRFIEYEKYIAIFVHDENDRFISEMYVKGEKEFRYWLYNSNQILDTKTEESSKFIYIKLATAIRDWKILIERDSTMQVRPRPMVPHGVKTNKKRWIYLPRVKYNRPDTFEYKKREKVWFAENKKFIHQRRAHVRKLPTGMKPSKIQMLLAEASNMYVPEGRTFVRKSRWNDIKKSPREIKYRNISLHGLFYGSDHERKKAAEIKQLLPAGFEEKMEEYIDGLGWQVTKRNNYDGGIDIRAIKEFKDGTIKNLLAQCKHWKKPVGPDVIREILGAEIVENNKSDNVLMVITSSRFTTGATKIASNHNVKLIDGDDLLK